MEHAQGAASRPRVILLCSPCIGHLIPFLELARRLVTDHGLAATVLFASATPSPSDEYLAVAAAVPDGVDLVALPLPADDSALPPSASVRDRVAHAVARSLSRVLQAARSAPPLAALVADANSAAALGVAAELGVPLYVFFTSPWTVLSLLLRLPELDAAIAGEYRDAAEPIRLPGCVPIAAADLPSPMLADRSSAAYTRFLHGASAFRKVSAFLVNTFHDLEPAVLGGGADGLSLPVHAVGPLVLARPRPATVSRDLQCLRWLDQQPRGSVVYVSFGSGGTLTWQQTAELALGLELSRHRFIWVVKRPNEDPLGCGTFFGSREGALDFLPKGFLERTTRVGMVVESWAPQAAILNHSSIGCFMTHCGWNSVLESVLNGVPLIAWPLYAEQRINAAMLEKQVGVATRVKLGGGLVCKEEVARVIKSVMENEDGEKLRNRICELKENAAHALSVEGSSTQAMAEIANLWKSGTY